MYCQACGAQLPSEAKACPNCGTLTSAYYADSGASPHDPTQAATSGSSLGARGVAPPPSTQYGSTPYEVNPYTPPPPPPPRKVTPLILGILIVLVLLIVGASVGVVFLRNNPTKTTNLPTATINTVSNTGNANANATATATTFYSLYDTATSSLPTKDDPLSNNEGISPVNSEFSSASLSVSDIARPNSKKVG